jgi:hypothetical protein
MHLHTELVRLCTRNVKIFSRFQVSSLKLWNYGISLSSYFVRNLWWISSKNNIALKFGRRGPTRSCPKWQSLDKKTRSKQSFSSNLNGNVQVSPCSIRYTRQLNEHVECTHLVQRYSNAEITRTSGHEKDKNGNIMGVNDETFFLGTAISSIAGAMAAPCPGSTSDWASGRGAGGGAGMMEDPEGRRGIATADAARLSHPAAAMDRFRVRGFIFSGSGLGTWGRFRRGGWERRRSHRPAFFNAIRLVLLVIKETKTRFVKKKNVWCRTPLSRRISTRTTSSLG